MTAPVPADGERKDPLFPSQAEREAFENFDPNADPVPADGGAAAGELGEAANFKGHETRECGEHRTVGPHRAWCFGCTEWCYPEDGCKGCRLSQARAEGAGEAEARADSLARLIREAGMEVSPQGLAYSRCPNSCSPDVLAPHNPGCSTALIARGRDVHTARAEGAGEERERIARAIEVDRDGPGPGDIRAKHPPEEWWKHGMSYAAMIARGHA